MLASITCKCSLRFPHIILNSLKITYFDNKFSKTPDKMVPENNTQKDSVRQVLMHKTLDSTFHELSIPLCVLDHYSSTFLYKIRGTVNK